MGNCRIFIPETDLPTVSVNAENAVKTGIFNSSGNNIEVLETEMEAMGRSAQLQKQ
jgi:hypothetical protein